MIDLLNIEKIKEVDLTTLGELVLEEEYRNYFKGAPGQEHYKLLGYISLLFNNETLLDIGTYKGCSALALSLNPTNQIKSFDIRQGLRSLSSTPNNVEFIIDNILDGKYINLIQSTNFIILDTDHNGPFEHDFYEHLKSIDWKGTLILDDIKLNDPMIVFWDTIIEEKYDISRIGHYSGTGLVIFK